MGMLVRRPIRRYDVSVHNVVERIRGDGTFRALEARIRQFTASPDGGAGGGCAGELWGAYAPALAAALADALNRPILYVTAHLEQADDARDDLELFCGYT